MRAERRGPEEVEALRRTELRFEPNAVVLLGGIPGAGKSYLLKRLDVPPTQIVSGDEYRGQFTDDTTNHDIEDEVWLSVRRKAGMRARLGKPSIVDMTSVFPHIRRQFTALTHDTGVPVHLVMIDSDVETSLSRQQSRGRLLPEDIFRVLHQRYHETVAAIRTGSILEEGFVDAVVLSQEDVAAIEALRFE